MKDNIQPCEVIESNLLNPTKETDLKTEFAEIRHFEDGTTSTFHTGGTIKNGKVYRHKEVIIDYQFKNRNQSPKP